VKTGKFRMKTLSFDDMKAQHQTEWCSGNIWLDNMTECMMKILLK
jgi:hypothetical protein